MNLKQWRASKAPQALTLSSGLEVFARKATLTTLIVEGDIPQTLDALVKKATTQGMSIGDLQEFLPLLNIVAKACLVNPTIADAPDETHITLRELSYEDRLDIFLWANSAANALGSFRIQPTFNAPARSDGRTVRRKTKRVPVHRG